MAKEAPKKGVAGKGTGAATRKAIADAQKAGCSLQDIASRANRSASTLSQIKAGTIFNPPADLAKTVQDACRAATAARS